jgi:thiol-disulfide isomerase/thioredoxin
MRAALAALVILLFGATGAAADPVSEFSLPDLDGTRHTLAPYRGKWIILNYWATDCPPCLKEIPELERFHQRHKDKDAVVLGVNYEDIKLSWLEDFIESVNMTYPVLRAEPGAVTPFGAIKILPTTIIVSPEGQLIGMQAGAVTAQMIDDYIRDRAAVPAENASRTKP